MAYYLSPLMSFCLDPVPVFLDLANDRYFRLPYPLEDEFKALAEGATVSDTALQQFSRLGILAPSGRPLVATQAPIACQSAFEMPRPPRWVSPFDLISVALIVLVTQINLKTRPLSKVLSLPRSGSLEDPAQGRPDYLVKAIDLTHRFISSRAYVPINTICLLDSLALWHFLKWHGIGATLVFGVCPAPFSAHCWLQIGDTVLNDALGYTRAHTPILVV